MTLESNLPAGEVVETPAENGLEPLVLRIAEQIFARLALDAAAPEDRPVLWARAFGEWMTNPDTLPFVTDCIACAKDVVTDLRRAAFLPG